MTLRQPHLMVNGAKSNGSSNPADEEVLDETCTLHQSGGGFSFI